MSKTLTKYNQVQRGTQVGQILTTIGAEFTLGLISGTVGQVPTIQGNGNLLFQDVTASVTLDPNPLNDITNTSGLFLDVSESTVTDTNNVVSGSTGGTTLVTLQTILDQISTSSFTLTNGQGTTANGSSVDLGGVINTEVSIDISGTSSESESLSINGSSTEDDLITSIFFDASSFSTLVEDENSGIGTGISQTFDSLNLSSNGSNSSQNIQISETEAIIQSIDNTNSDTTSIKLSPTEIIIQTPNIYNSIAVTGQFLGLNSTSGEVEFSEVLPTNATIGDLLYYNGTNWAKLTEVEDVQIITGTTITLSSVPILQPRPKLYRNGTLQQEGTGNDYTISGSTITWEYVLNSDLITSIYYTV